MKLFSKLIRDIRQSLGQFIALILVVAVGAFSTGVWSPIAILSALIRKIILKTII